MTGDSYGGDTGADSSGIGDMFSSFNLNQALSTGVQAFGIYEGAQTAKAATNKLTSSSLVYVILGLGALGLLGLIVFKH